jgi:hypothetical protein
MLSRESVTAQGGYGMCFCRPGRNYVANACIVVQCCLVLVICQDAVVRKKAQVGAPYVEPARLGREALSRC